MRKVLTRATPNNEVTEREVAHRELARKVAAESIVLLKNDGVLPIEPSPVALFGAGAATTIKGGTGSGEVNERFSVTIEQGLTNAGFEVKSNAWLREYEELLAVSKKNAYKKLAWKVLSQDPDVRINIMADAFQYPVGRLITPDDLLAGASDTCIYVIARLAGECSERSLDGEGFYLSESEIENLKTAANSYKNTILILNVSGPMDLSPLDDIQGINAILFYCMQGMEGGNALADILTGQESPSGCLSSTWPMKYEDLPCAMEYSNLNGDSITEEYKEGIYVGYRFFDSFDVEPRFEFGYGLSYASFDINHKSTVVSKGVATVKAKVTNTNKTHAGKLCVQLYVSAPDGKLHREHQSLAAFTKTQKLAPGESENVILSFPLTDIAGFDEQSASFLLEPGEYKFRLGTSSKRTKLVAIHTLKKEFVTEVCTNICKLEQELEELLPVEQEFTLSAPEAFPGQGKEKTISPRALKTKVHNYQVPEPQLSEKTAKVLKRLETKDLLKLVVATGFIDYEPYVSVCGAAAYTTSHLVHMGVPNAALCDGPAGLRLNKTLVQYKNGKIKPVDTNFDLLNYMPWFLRSYLLGNPRKGEALYQYTSAFPVGTALAQTWNTELIEQVGKAIGTEMVEFGATYLLAPGMNIQRNPLCGRNYEYYSEDPLLTGKIAASVTKGVQSFDGCYVTIKHFAANNQETMRNRSNSVVGERTLREIYLKGFRIAVEEGGAKGVMTSYNLINGVYTPNSYDLCTTLLRCEWGFEGVVMTDWFSTDKGLAGNGLAIKAGNDLICPGSKKINEALKADFDAEVVSLEELRLSASRVLEAVMNGRTGMV